MRPETWMRAAAVCTWLVAISPTTIAFARGDLATSRSLAFALVALAFLAAFVAACRVPVTRRTTALALRAAQSLAAIAMVWLGRDVVTAAIFVVVASQLPPVVSARVATAWIAAQSLIIPLRGGHVGAALVNCAAFVGFQAFALAATSLVASERRARAVAAEQGRTVERLRVARDLHDSLGHHLAALGMQLEVAGRLVDGRAKEHVERAHAIGRLLLADVRDAVSDLRDPRPLGAALRTLVDGATDRTTVHLDLADELADLAGDRADAIVRYAQEVITNTARHADARNLWIAISADRTAIHLSARDDGRRSAPDTAISPGHGLTGMTERFASLGGRVDARRLADGGFEVRASLPRETP